MQWRGSHPLKSPFCEAQGVGPSDLPVYAWFTSVIITNISMRSNAKFIPCAANSMIVSLLPLFVLSGRTPFASAGQGRCATLKGWDDGATDLDDLSVLIRIKELKKAAVSAV